jgi:hypothetical protein
MAINLWKLGGQASDFEVLPSNLNTKVSLGIGEYIVKFKAKSNSGARVRIGGMTSSVKVENLSPYILTLTNVLTEYVLNVRALSSDALIFYDGDKVGDISVKNIELVQKPLGEPKRTLRPKNYVPKKNLFDKSKMIIGEYISFSDGIAKPSASGNNASDFIDCLPDRLIKVMGVTRNGALPGIAFYDDNKKFISGFPYTNNILTDFTTPSKARYFRFSFNSSVDGIVLYDTADMVLPKAKTGLRFEGDSYVQLPSMTMDSVEIECLIDAVQPNSNPFLLDARNGLANGYFSKLGHVGVGWSSLTVDGITKQSKLWSDIPNNQRTKVKLTANQFIDDVSVFGFVTGGTHLKATLYKVTCYLAGQVVAQYDFENPSNIVGDKVLPNAKNLIPSFEDSRWNLHSNFKVLGKDVGRLDAGGLFQNSIIVLDALPNTQYTDYITTSDNSRAYMHPYSVDANGVETNLGSTNGKNGTTFTTRTDTKKIKIFLANNVSGTFDFVRPQLYELTGKEATIVGKPTQLLKAPKRVLYARR